MTKRRWYELSFACAREQSDAVSDVLFELQALSVTFQSLDETVLIEPDSGEMPLWTQLTLTALFDDEATLSLAKTAMLERYPNLSPIQTKSFTDQDWQAAYQKTFEPVHVTQDIWVLPAGAKKPEEADIALSLDPGLAFGTGSHPTTAMCMGALSECVQVGDSVIDFGCGSGILAILAARLGAKTVKALDIDEAALDVCVDNAKRNGVASILDVAKPEQLSDHQADVLVANILLTPLISLSETLLSHLKPGGHLILSGVLETQIDRLKAAYPTCEFEVLVRDGWCCCRADKKS
jgi:ribosomal protein L11 methyltransferase